MKCHNHDKQPSQKRTDVLYICPMHPEIQQSKPGDCPICGMSLEPETLSEDTNSEYMMMKRRFWLAIILTIPVVFIDMSGHFLKRTLAMAPMLQLILATPVVFWCGKPFFERGIKSIITRHLNMFTLIAMGIGIAWGYSVAATLFPKLFPLSFRHQGSIPIYFESASMITTLVLLGQVLELKARAATGHAIKALLDLKPDTANLVLKNGSIQSISLDEVKLHDILQIRPGEKIPVDGEVIEGRSYVDESMVTGEAQPVIKEKMSQVIEGTLNQTGSFTMKALRVGKDTLLARIIHMVHDAQRSRAPIQRVADVVSGWFVPIVILIAFLSFIGWVVLAHESAFSYGLISAISVLIIACPCVLGLATPMSIMVGIGKGAQHGILIKNAEQLEQMEQINQLVVDKTGTLTEGRPQLTEVIPVDDEWHEDELLQLAASIEKQSEHPIGAAFIAKAHEKNLNLLPIKHFESHTGIGVTANIEGYDIALGKQALVKQLIDNKSAVLTDKVDELTSQGATVIYMMLDKKFVGLFAVSDPIKANAPAAIRALVEQGVDICMLTGDNEKTANAIAHQLGIKKVIAEVLPTDKGHEIQALKQGGQRVAMAGDGINDAPALALADVGIAMGTGSDAAIANAGITLLHGDLGGIVQARKLSQVTMRNIKQNLFFAFFYNALGVPVAAGVLYPFTGVLLNPSVAALAMALSSVSVILNSLRLNYEHL